MNVGNVDDEYVRYMIMVQRALGLVIGNCLVSTVFIEICACK